MWLRALRRGNDIVLVVKGFSEGVHFGLRDTWIQPLIFLLFYFSIFHVEWVMSAPLTDTSAH